MNLDLFTVDQSVARAHTTLGRALAKLPNADPTDDIREVASQATYKALAELDASPTLLHHRDALVRWVCELLQARVAWPLLVDESEAIDVVDPSVGRPGSVPIAKTWREALANLTMSPNVDETDRALRRLDAMALPVAAVRKELRFRRFEVALRLGHAHPWTQANELAALARSVLDATDALSTQLLRDQRKRNESDIVSAAFVIDGAFGRDAREGWPAHLTGRWFEDVFRAIAPRAPRNVELPEATSGASFLRGGYAWGVALRFASTARSLPFALSRDPQPVHAHAFGSLLAIAIADRVFAKKRLEIPVRGADIHARALGRVLLLGLRRAAVDVLLGLPETVSASAVEELSTRLYGVPLPPDLGSAWVFGGFAGKTRLDAPSRLVGALRGHALLTSLVERFDEDWFANPRAGAHLASMGAGPVWDGDALPETIPVARALEESLG